MPYDVDVDNAHDEQQATEYVVDLYKHYKSVKVRGRSRPTSSSSRTSMPRCAPCSWIGWWRSTSSSRCSSPRCISRCRLLTATSFKADPPQEAPVTGCVGFICSLQVRGIYPPEVADFTYITDHAYAAEGSLDMEMKILLELDWKITAPNAHLWIERLCAVSRASSRVKHRAEYYCSGLCRSTPCSTSSRLKLRRRPSIYRLVAEARENRDNRDCWPRPCGG